MQKYEIFINPKMLNQLNKDIWMDEHVPAVLKIDNNKYSIGLAYRGNVIRKKKKKSYNIVFQKPYMVNGAHEIHLNAEFNDISLSRNKLSLDFFDRIGVPSPHSKHILLYINGFCKGIYLELESFDQFLLQKRKFPMGPIIYATNYYANFSLLSPKKKLKKDILEGYTIKYGEEEDWSSLEELITMTNTLKNEEFEEQIQKVLNVKQYLTWLAGVVCTQNFDGFIHNYALYRNSETNTFEITPWDYDGSWGRDLHGRPLDHDFIPITGYNTLTGRLLYSAKYRKKYCEILSAILDNEFTIETQSGIISDLFESLKLYIHLDPYLHRTSEVFDPEKDFILNFIEKRNSYLKQELIKLQDEKVYG